MHSKVAAGRAAGVTTTEQAASATGDRKPDLIFRDLAALLEAAKAAARSQP